MGFFSSDKALKNDMDLQDLPDLENQRSDVKPRPTSNYLIPTALILFGLFALVLITGFLYYISTSGDQSTRFASEIHACDEKAIQLEGSVLKSLQDQTAGFASEIAERDAKTKQLVGIRVAEALKDICNPRKIFADPTDAGLDYSNKEVSANGGVVSYKFECRDEDKLVHYRRVGRRFVSVADLPQFRCDTKTGQWDTSKIYCGLRFK
eukprot:855640_1